MFSPKMGQAGFRIAIYIVLVSGGLTFVTDKGTAEHAISLLTLIIGLVFMGLILALVFFSRYQDKKRK